MRPMRRCKKPRLEGGSDEEDEKENELNALVRKLPCYQGEGSKKSLELEDDEKQLEDKQRQLVEERKQLVEKRKQLREKLEEKLKRARVEGEKAKVEREKAEMKKEKLCCHQSEGSLAIKSNNPMEVERGERELEEGRKQLQEELKRVEEVKIKLQEDRVKVEEEKTRMEEKRTRMEEVRITVEKLIKEQESLVECPVCLSLPREDRPVPCCPKGHFVCTSCLDNLIREGKPRNCPTCRVRMGEGRSLLALTVVKNARHECGHQGCNAKLNFDQIKDHEEKCIWRPILCPGKGTSCRARVPFCTVLDHVQTCQDCHWPPTEQVYGLGLFLNHNIMMDTVVRPVRVSSWSTKVLQFEGSFFFVRSEKRDGNYVVDVVMKGSQEDCEDFKVKASLLNVESRKSLFEASFQPRPLTDQNEPTYCLSVPEKGVSKAWKYNEAEGNYTMKYYVKIIRLN